MLNVSDFLTAELHLPWGEASRILRDTYAAQLAHGQTQAPAATLAPPRPNPTLWADYRRDWPPLQRQAEAAADKAQRDSERKRRADLRQIHQAGRRKIQGDKTLTPAAAKAARSVLAMTKVQDDMTLREAIKAEREALKATRRRTPLEHFRAYLMDRAGRGDAEALGELRLQRVEQPAQGGERIEGKESTPKAPLFAQHSYDVDRAGNVTYYDGTRRAMFTDHGRTVRFAMSQEREALEAGLRLAIAKYGQNIKLTGTEEYKRAIIEIAADTGSRVHFDDAEHRAQYDARREAMRLGREYIDQAGRAGSVEPTPAQRPPARPPEALDAVKVKEAATEASPTPAALDRAGGQTRRDLEDLAPRAPAPEPVDTEVGDAFAELASLRDGRGFGYQDESKKWLLTPTALRDRIDRYNRLPEQEQAAERDKINRDPETRENIKGLLEQRETAIQQKGRGR